MNSFTIAFWIFSAVLTVSLVSAVMLKGPYTIPKYDMKHLPRLETHMKDISKSLSKKLKDYTSPEENIKAAKLMLENPGFLSSKLKKEALELFVSLEYVASNCDRESFKRLSRANFAIGSDYPDSRVSKVFEDFRTKNNNMMFCGPGTPYYWG